jgi:hypothetical protein
MAGRPPRNARAMSIGRIAWMWAWRLAIVLAVVWQIYRFQGTHTMIAFVLMIPIIGVLLAKPVIESLGAWFNWARKQPYEKWQGNYYEFANIQIRIVEDGDTLWFCDADVFSVLEIPSSMVSTRINLLAPGERKYLEEHGLHALSEQGVLRLLEKAPHRDALPMKHWIEREVIKPFRRKRELREGQNGASPTGETSVSTKPLDIIVTEHISETDRERRHQNR